MARAERRRQAGGSFYQRPPAMPRRTRLELPGIPMRLTHRGVNRAAVFLDAGDFEDYRQALHECFTGQGVAVHAYVTC